MRAAIAAFIIGATVLAAAEIPRPASEYVIKLPNGQQELLSKYKGKVVAMEFLLTTCPHCQNTAKVLSKLNQELGPKGFQPLGVAINPGADLGGFATQNNVTYPLGMGDRDSAMVFLQHSLMAQFYVPQLVLIDRKGMIRAQYSGTDTFLSSNEEMNIRGMVEKLMNESAPAKAAKSRKKAS
ncbi:MAG: TlpA disulfide reductase family protein [Bryobacteraceae bacterium]